MSDTRRVFFFSFHEHDFSAQDVEEDEAEQAYFQMLASQDWTLHDEQGSRAVESYGEESDLDALKEAVRVSLTEYCGMPPEFAKWPFDKLAALMARDGLEFVGGSFCEFQGNNTDTEIYAVLRKK